MADAVLAAVETGRPEVFVPGRMSALRTARALVPQSVLGWAVRATGADRQILGAAPKVD